jgi:RNA polymerase sigma-70 factor (ECF subfamily)
VKLHAGDTKETSAVRSDAHTSAAVVDAARGGSDDAFRAIVDDHRLQLHAHCYRMLGSVHDAEDALQETLLRAWRGMPAFAGRSSLRRPAMPWIRVTATT